MSSFQFGIFTEVLSTSLNELENMSVLWVPFNLVFLPKFFQLYRNLSKPVQSCEFLSIWYFYRSSFNLHNFISFLQIVVSSFQFGIFTEVLSTNHNHSYIYDKLWVPFNLVFLPKFFQQATEFMAVVWGCEFLSIWYFYRSSFNWV